jgi:hypothetical protein
LKDALKSGLTEGVISGGMAYMSGAPKADIDNAAKNAAADATIQGPRLPELDADSAAAREAFLNPPDVSGAATQPRYLPQGDGSYIDTFNYGQYVSPDQARQLGLGRASTGPIADTVAKQGIFGTPEAKAAYGFGPDAAQAAAPIAAPVNNLTSSYSGRDIPGMPNPDFDLNANLSGSMATPPSAPGFYDKNVAPFFKKAGDLYDEYIDPLMPSSRQKAGIPDAQKAYSEAYESAMQMPRMTAEGAKAMAMKAYDAAMPGILSTYGPVTAAGIGTLALAGGFNRPDEPTPEPGPTGMDLLQQDPNKYLVQGLPGVQYGAQGNIIGSQAFGPSYSMQDIRVPTRYDSQVPMFANGGIAALAQGGYPRRVGQISGPGTEKSDSIPAMLSDGEFVMTAKAVRGAGGGSRRDGAKRMYALMHQLERNAARG